MHERAGAVAPRVPRVPIVHLDAGELVDAVATRTTSSRSTSLADATRASRSRRSAIPSAFVAQLEALGARVRRDGRSAIITLRRAPTSQRSRAIAPADELVVCTLKDAVKLAPLWPRRAPPLWYVSQRVDRRARRAAASSACSTTWSARAPRDARSRPPAAPARFIPHGHRPSTSDR